MLKLVNKNVFKKAIFFRKNTLYKHKRYLRGIKDERTRIKHNYGRCS